MKKKFKVWIEFEREIEAKSLDDALEILESALKELNILDINDLELNGEEIK